MNRRLSDVLFRASVCALGVFCLLALPAVAAEPQSNGAEPAARPSQVTPANISGMTVDPQQVELRRNYDRAQLVVTATGDSAATAENSLPDLTHQVSYVSTAPGIVAVDENGRLLAKGDGQAKITITLGSHRLEVPVTVTGVVAEPAISFDEQVMPILSKAGCNMGACHATQYGQGGFKLSVFGFEPSDDYTAIRRDRLQRRINLINPTESLLLKKPTMQVPHGGGKRLDPASVDYRILVDWLKAGAPGVDKEAAHVEKMTVTPNHRLSTPGESQQLRVSATFSDGTERDVTAWAQFDSMDDAVLDVDENGRVSVIGKGQAPLMVRFGDQAEIATFVVPYSDSVQLAGWESRNIVDELAAEKFRELGIEPSPECDDATFLRRAFLDSIGTLPSVEVTREFLASEDPDKRTKLVDRLLGLTGDPKLDIYNDQYAAYWTLKWSDLIRNDSSRGSVEQAMWALHNWIRESFRTNRPFNEFVTELVTGKGSIYMNGPANYFRINSNSSDLAESTAQLFLGVRLQCAKCHHHPFETISQADYYSFAAFFARVGTKRSEEFGLFGRESVVVVKSSGSVRHPKTREVLPPTPLFGEPVDHPLDLRIPLAEWLTSSDNRMFASSVVNRYVAYLLGRGLVEPIDDMRATNPASNVKMMDALTDEFIKSGFDIKHLIRTIMVSRLYQLDSQPTPENLADRRFYSYYKVKRISAEPLLDAIDRTTMVQTKFKSLPMGTRAIELPDSEYPNYFLNTFGKPKRASVCECERSPDESLAQALHTLNGDILAEKISGPQARIARLLKEKKSHEAIVEDLFLATLCRYPTEAEKAAADRFLKESPSPKEAYEDLHWALVNSKQFLFIH